MRTPAILALLLCSMAAPAAAQDHERLPVHECRPARYPEPDSIPRSDRPEVDEENEPVGLERACHLGLVEPYRRRRDEGPVRALLWSVLLPGGGQLYNGEMSKGLWFLGAGVAGAAIAFGPDERDSPRFYIGIGLAGGAYVGSVFDAVRSGW